MLGAVASWLIMTSSLHFWEFVRTCEAPRRENTRTGHRTVRPRKRLLQEFIHAEVRNRSASGERISATKARTLKVLFHALTKVARSQPIRHRPKLFRFRNFLRISNLVFFL